MQKIWILLAALAMTTSLVSAKPQTISQDAETTMPQRNVILITIDGLRWQELFRGIDEDMLTTGNKVQNREILLSEYDAETTDARRAKLMPFFWNHIAKNGVVWGNEDKGSSATVTNNQWFSYPGYNEILTGAADDARINSNKAIPNPNVTVFEWLAKKPGIDGRVAAFSSWVVHAAIFNSGRCGFPVDAGGREFKPSTGVTPGMKIINDIRADIPRQWGNEPYDGLIFPMFLEYLKDQKPRVAYMGYGETDSWCHDGDYPAYLTAAHRADKNIKLLWEQLQSDPFYKDNTTIIVTCDHGRGDKAQGEKSWNDHGITTVGSNAIFVAVFGPDTPATGEVTSGVVTQSQIAATVAEALGYDFNADYPDAGKPIEGAFNSMK